MRVVPGRAAYTVALRSHLLPCNCQATMTALDDLIHLRYAQQGTGCTSQVCEVEVLTTTRAALSGFCCSGAAKGWPAPFRACCSASTVSFSSRTSAFRRCISPCTRSDGRCQKSAWAALHTAWRKQMLALLCRSCRLQIAACACTALASDRPAKQDGWGQCRSHNRSEPARPAQL